MRKRLSGFMPALVFLLLICANVNAGQSVFPNNIVTANYDNNRTNWNSAETTLTPDSVTQGGFGKVGAFPVDGQIYAQPLYVQGEPIPGQGVRNVVYVATMNDSVYALDADNPSSNTPLWRVSLGVPVPSAAIPDLLDLNPQVGILSTPVIDTVGQAIYVVSETFEYGAPVFRLHGLSLADGHEMLKGPIVISASAPGAGSASVNGIIAFDPYWHLQRPGLALANGAIYIAFGSHGDAGNYHGWVIAYSAVNLQQQLAVFNSTPNGNGGGIWQSGRAPAVDSAGNIYVATGNGDFDGSANFGSCVIKLSGSKLALLDWYTPSAWQYLNDNDLDVGSVGPILVPGSQLLMTGDKGGRIISLNQAALGHLEANPGADAFAASPSGIFQLAVSAANGTGLVYQHDWDGSLKSYPIAQMTVSPSPVSQNSTFVDSQYPGMALSSSGSSGAILWETTGDHSQAGVPGTLHAYDASTLQELWNTNLDPGDALGGFAKFAAPLVANGRVYVATFSDQLEIYGTVLADEEAVPVPQITAVLNAASFLPGAVAPGELVAIFGANLGPATGQSLQLDQNGLVSNILGGTRVFFDGTPAPLLYASAGQVNAVVPFGVAGPSTQIVVQNNGLASGANVAPVAPAAPALFTLSGLGSGQAAVLNQDGSVNSAVNPASVGSIVALFATGLGQTSPASQDGALTGSDLPYVTLPVQVLIDGMGADVVYAGGAPGMVEGVYQMDVRLPPLAPIGSVVFITVQVGAALGPSGIWLAIE